ncbi:hypothetical protein DFH11DRAFT_1618577 [Phellopilus nigrolimitatus]|nr:hypothetical protein DFH11DRAFT_1618577 [Phellopilus nigrolimitatus]
MKINGHIARTKHTSRLVTPRYRGVFRTRTPALTIPGKAASRDASAHAHRAHVLTAGARTKPPIHATSMSATLVDGMSSAPGTESSVASPRSRHSSTDPPNDVQMCTDPESAVVSLDIAKFPRFFPTLELSIHVDNAARAVA